MDLLWPQIQDFLEELRSHSWCPSPAVESSIAVEDAVEDRGLYRVFVSCSSEWESAKVSHKRVFALLTPEIHSYEMAQMLQKPVFALPGLSANEREHPFV